MQRILGKYALAAHLAFLAVAPAFLSPYAILWLSFSAAVWVLMEPTCLFDEHLHDARKRVRRAILHDPAFWATLAFAGVAIFRLINTGIALGYDAETSQWSLKLPPFPILPGSVSGVGFAEADAALAAVIVIAGCRNALGRAARTSFLLMTSVFAGGYAFVLAIQLGMGRGDAAQLVACELMRPSYAGVLFALGLLGGTAGLATAFERRWNRMLPLGMFGICGCAAGAFLFAPAWCGVVFASAFVILFLYSFIYLRRFVSAAGEFRYSVVLLISFVLAGVLVTAATPKAILADKIAPWMTGAFFPQGYMDLRVALSAIAFKVWRAHAWLGTGLGSFPLDIQFNATSEDWKIIAASQVASINGYWQLLAERGIIGAVLLASPFGTVAWTYGQRLATAISNKARMPDPCSWVGLVAVLALLTDAAADISFLAPGTALVALSYLAISANSFPKEKIDG